MRSEWLEKDYYATLGVASDASAKEIKKSFRKLARSHHPDSSPGNADAEERFKEINEAYDVLSDDDQRGAYDEARAMRHAYAGHRGFEQQVRVEDLFHDGAPFDLGDLFSQVRREPRPRRGTDLETDMSLSFDEAVSGASRSVELDGETFTASHQVADRKIHQYERQVVRLEFGTQVSGILLIGKLNFDGIESGSRRQADTFEQRNLAKQRGNISAETWQRLSLSRYSFAPILDVH